MFTALKTVSKSELTKLNAANAEYAELLSTSHGRAFEANVGNADIIKLYAALASPQAASGASGDGGASADYRRLSLVYCCSYSYFIFLKLVHHF